MDGFRPCDPRGRSVRARGRADLHVDAARHGSEPARRSSAAGDRRVLCAARNLSVDLRRRHDEACARRSRVPAIARPVAAAGGHRNAARNDGVRDQYRRLAGRHVAGRILRIGLAVQPDFRRPPMERAGAARDGIRLRNRRRSSANARPSGLRTAAIVEEQEQNNSCPSIDIRRF